MAKITYVDPSEDDAAPKITWFGVVFRNRVPTEVDDVLQAKLIEAARKHPYFSVEEPDQEEKPAEATLPPLPKAAAKR